MSAEYEGKPLVSVVIPAYNAEKFIRDAIASIESQSYRPVEIVVVNDGSTDSTPQIVRELVGGRIKDGLVLRLIDIEVNKGAANALNVGFRNAKGEYICWLSADDVWVDREKVSRQLDAMKREQAMWSYFKDSLVGPSETEARLMKPFMPGMRWLYGYIISRPGLMFMLLLFRNPVNGSSVMISRDCVNRYGQFDPELRNIDADSDLWMRYSVLGVSPVVVKGAPVFYREHGEQTSKKLEAMVHGGELARMRILKALEKRRMLSTFVRKFSLLFPLVLRPDMYKYRPIVIRYLFADFIRNAPILRFPFARLYCLWVLRKVRKGGEPVHINANKFFDDLEHYMKTETFKSFETMLGAR
ncbi:MAG: glycosyltransferase family 2 protein [Thermoplasmata archaeon]